MVRILLIDDDEHTRISLTRLLAPLHRVHALSPSNFTVETLARHAPDIVLLDPGAGASSGVRLIRSIVAVPYPPPVIAYSSAVEPPLVVAAIKAGAHDYLVKPARATEIRNSVASAIAQGASIHDGAQSTLPTPLDAILGESKSVQRLKARIARFAPAKDPILILGESGTGKELAARIAHEISPRSSGPFIDKNCAAIPEGIFEADMFGVERGAFTDAVERPGCFELADKGTLFLDEIGDMSLNSQSKLLRVLEDGVVTRVGSRYPKRVDVRVIAATNRNLKQAVADGEFRRDLFYRISILALTLSPLRERMEDLPILAAHFLARSDGGATRLSHASMQKLMEYHWPGNVRELYGTIRRAALLSEHSTVEPHHITFY